MRVQEISGKDVRNMKARSLYLAASSKRGPNSVGQGRQIQDLRGFGKNG